MISPQNAHQYAETRYFTLITIPSLRQLNPKHTLPITRPALILFRLKFQAWGPIRTNYHVSKDRVRPAECDISIYDVHFCLPVLHFSFVEQSQTSLKSVDIQVALYTQYHVCDKRSQILTPQTWQTRDLRSFACMILSLVSLYFLIFFV